MPGACQSGCRGAGCAPGVGISECHPAHQCQGHEAQYERNGQTETYQGDIVVVSAGATNSATLLLMSANDKHPNGLANGSDQVGRNYMYHNSVAVLAVSKEPNPTQFQKTLGLNDFYFGMEGFGYP